MKYALVSGVIGLVTYGQLIIKHRISKLGESPGLDDLGGLFRYMFSALTDIGIMSGLAAAVGAALLWMVTLSRFELSAVYPMLALNFLLVPILSVALFGEEMNAMKGIGLAIVIAGLVVFTQGLAAPGIAEAD